ncbi:MAG: phenylalanine--tRNA ligase subunit beta [Lactobacillus sp.]|jgi:phenylalanyl-tRNA synthetase beta chain|nr:phenylalanine--tRNA ligase subunit beta [Lactobacillus sp.]MCH3990359.1 phenylalanine--tRNA ligase subunit beta [Lactobacillus sp.]MCH4068926.1 phenylalanine--tRNA ligase subunit beta [Lactobacillus sp.]MCI1303328.1 phenylalanine--tRNA ligase subunit beta [Lactobacillus sp.]MCI1329404.1 phenylalanine--tRNA ligase subunit beta [Lactobacillus sp.]
MLISYNWLQDFLKLDIEPAVLAEKITRTGVEIPTTDHPMDGLKKLVVGHVLTCEKVEGTHLHKCQVEVGEDEPIQIVCGAPNVASSQDVIVALHGARIAGNEKIKRGKIRGIESNGMICGLQEIGFPDKLVPAKYLHGIFVFPADSEVEPGQDVYHALGMDDYIFDFDITPNRADTLSMEGAAYEVGAIIDQKPKIEQIVLKEDGPAWTDSLKVEVDPKLAPKYYLRKLTGVKITESPLWLQTRLWNAGIRPVNNVVDATNYAMLLTGQPLHAYDAKTFADGKLAVRKAQAGEKLELLNEKELDLDAQDIVIANGKQAVGLAGVMGGLHSEVTDETTDVLLEAAVFDPALVRKTALRHANRTDASARFEKGLNWDNVQKGIDIAAMLMRNHAQATVDEGLLKASDEQRQPVVVKTTVSHINHVLGTKLSGEAVVNIFDRLGFGHELADDDLTITVPNRRWDIEIPADLIEEVGRLYGYDNLESTQPLLPETHGGYSERETKIRRLRKLVEGQGLNETINYTLTAPKAAKLFTKSDHRLVKVSWPMNSGRSALRQSLMIGLLEAVSYNFTHQQDQLTMFEQGRVYNLDNGKYNELEHLAAIYTGTAANHNWQKQDQPIDFYWVKGQLTALLAAVGLTDLTFKAAVIPGMHPTRTAAVYAGERYLGFVGMLAPILAVKNKNLQGHDMYGYELNLEALLPLMTTGVKNEPAPKYPGMERDISLLIDKGITNAQVVDCIKENGGKYLQDVQVMDVYDGMQIEHGKKSLSYRLLFLNKEATLTEDVVNKAIAKIDTALFDQLEAKIR